MAVEIQKTLCEGRNIDNLIKSMCFYLKYSRFHVFCLNFSQARIFCDDNRSTLVPGSTQSRGFLGWTIVNNLHEKPKNYI